MSFYKIPFEYIFNDDINRVYNSMKNYYILSEVGFKNITQNNIKIQGTNFDDKNGIFKFSFKNYNNLIMKTENVLNKPFFKKFSHRINYIDNIPVDLLINYEFYWNSIEKETIFFYNFIIKDKLYVNFFKDEFLSFEKKEVCVNIDNYLQNSTKDLEIKYGTVCNDNIMNVWNIFKNNNLLNDSILINVKYRINPKDDIEELGTIIDFFSYENNEYCKLIAKMNVNFIEMNENRIKIVLKNNEKKFFLPKQYLILIINYLDKKHCFLEFLLIPLEPLTKEIRYYMKKYLKKSLFCFKEYFANLKNE